MQAPARPTTRFYEIKQILRENNLHTVCEEASCPNIGECFGKGTATFMIMGDKCTRRCPFCDVGHGRPDPLDVDEPREPGQDHRRAEAQVRGDHQRRPRRPARRRRRPLRRLHPQDPRAFARARTIEVLVPDFRGRDDRALEILKAAPPDVMNHNLETVAAPVQGSAPRLGLPVQPEPAEEVQGAAPGRADQERHHGGPGRDRRRDPAGHARHARARHRHADHRPVPGAAAPATCRCAATCTRTPSRCSRQKPTRWASATPPSARWCAPATTPTSRRTPPASRRPIR